jgi:phage-related baseplate assembly protein
VDAYIYWALATDPANIMDAYAYRFDGKGNVQIVVAGFDVVGFDAAIDAGDPVAQLAAMALDVPDATLDLLWAQFARTDIVPLTDIPRPVRAARFEYTVEGSIYVPPGAMAASRVAAAVKAVAAYGVSRCRITGDVHPSGIIGAAMVPGVEDVELTAPGYIAGANERIPKMTAVNLRTVILD